MPEQLPSSKDIGKQYGQKMREWNFREGQDSTQRLAHLLAIPDSMGLSATQKAEVMVAIGKVAEEISLPENISSVIIPVNNIATLATILVYTALPLSRYAQLETRVATGKQDTSVTEEYRQGMRRFSRLIDGDTTNASMQLYNLPAEIERETPETPMSEKHSVKTSTQIALTEFMQEVFGQQITEFLGPALQKATEEALRILAIPVKPEKPLKEVVTDTINSLTAEKAKERLQELFPFLPPDEYVRPVSFEQFATMVDHHITSFDVFNPPAKLSKLNSAISQEILAIKTRVITANLDSTLYSPKMLSQFIWRTIYTTTILALTAEQQIDDISALKPVHKHLSTNAIDSLSLEDIKEIMTHDTSLQPLLQEENGEQIFHLFVSSAFTIAKEYLRFQTGTDDNGPERRRGPDSGGNGPQRGPSGDPNPARRLSERLRKARLTRNPEKPQENN